MRVYVASSWSNKLQPMVVEALRRRGHEVYDFRNPPSGTHGFKWSEIDPNYERWSPDDYRLALADPMANAGFGDDLAGMAWAEVGVLVLPCGRSAHTEAGWMAGQGKPVVAMLDDSFKPELMYKLFTSLCLNIDETIDALAFLEEVLHGDDDSTT